MQKILISGHNPTFKNNFMNSLQFKKNNRHIRWL